MSNEHRSWESTEPLPSRDIFAAELVRDPGPDGRNPVATEIGGWLSRTIESVRAAFRRKRGKTPAEEPAPGSILAGKATATAVGAIEGTLKGKSLDGALKEAQVLEAYASARQKNAEAVKLEAEAEKLKQDAAFERLERAIALIERLGAPVGLARLPGGGLAVTVGDRLVGELPDINAGDLPEGLVTSGTTEAAPTGEPSPTAPPPTDVSQAPGGTQE